MLTIETEGDENTSVRVRADEILYIPSESTYSTDEMHAISVVGPEQAVRALVSGCAKAKASDRPVMCVRGKYGTAKMQWRWSWRTMGARSLGPGAFHLVAISPGGGDKQFTFRPIVPPTPGDVQGIVAAIYETLLTDFTTPLLPVHRPGQPERERAAGLVWRSRIVERVMADTRLWHPMKGHSDQPSNRWAGAGMLAMSNTELDAIVSEMIRKGRLPVPRPVRKEVA